MCTVPLFVIIVPIVVVLSPFGLPFFLVVLGYWYWDTRKKKLAARRAADALPGGEDEAVAAE